MMRQAPCAISPRWPWEQPGEVRSGNPSRSVPGGFFRDALNTATQVTDLTNLPSSDEADHYPQLGLLNTGGPDAISGHLFGPHSPTLSPGAESGLRDPTLDLPGKRGQSLGLSYPGRRSRVTAISRSPALG